MDNKHLVNIALQHIKDDNPHGIDDIKKGIYDDIDGIHADLNTVKTNVLQVNSKSDSIQGFLDSVKSEVDNLPSVIEARGKLAEAVSLSFIDNKISQEEAKRISEVLDSLNEAKGYTDVAKIGTEQYINSVKTEVIDYSDTLLYHFEEALGPLAFEDKIELARLGETVIDGGYLKTELIKAHSIGAHHINTDELVVGDNIIMGPNAVITWDNLSEDSKENLKGEDGVDGKDGEDGYTPVKGTDYFDGEDGQDGESKYLWVKYSQNSSGISPTDDPTGAKYIGIATTITNVKPTNYLSYSWSLIKGQDGQNGIKGETGPNGQTSYLHIKYSNNGTTFTSNSGEAVGSWIGTYVDFVEADSTVFGRYTWNKVKGEDGSDADVPDYIKTDHIASTTITESTIESPTIIGGTITGGSITSNSTINVTTDAHIGDNLYLGEPSGRNAKMIRFNNQATISSGEGAGSPRISVSAETFSVDGHTFFGTYGSPSETHIYGTLNLEDADVVGLSSSGSNARGKWIRFADGVQMCWYNTILTYTSGTTIDNSWTYPMEFIDPPAVSGNATNTATVVHRSLAIYFTSVSSSSCTALMSRPTGSTDFSTSDTRNVSFMAVGMWK